MSNELRSVAVSKVAEICKTCEAEVVGKFCPACGQRHRKGRLTFKGISGEFAAEFLKFDRGIVHTLWSLMRRPGQVIRDVINGRSVPYTPAIRFFVITLAFAQIISFWIENTQDFASGFSEGAGPDFFDAKSTVHFFTEYFVLIAAGVVPFSVLGTRLLLARARYNFVEHAVFHLYTMGQGALIYTALTLLAEPFPDHISLPLTAAGIAAFFLYYIWSASSFFPVSKIRSAVCTVLALGFSSTGYTLCLLLLGFLLR